MRSRMLNEFALVGGALLLASCQLAPTGSVAQSSAAREPSPGLSNSVLIPFTENNNRFGLEFYQLLAAHGANLVFSPYSLSSALAMTYAGARSETESQMAAALHYDLPQEQLHAAFNQLDQLLTTGGDQEGDSGQPLTIKIANAIWADQTLPVLDQYLDVMARNYGAGVRLADFAGSTEGARIEINSWVSQQTEQRIRDLISQGALESSTRMVLVNAIYFKGDWQDPFNAADTHAGPFHLLDGTSVGVQMMHAHPSGARYLAGDGYQAVQLPYGGATAAMTILVPDHDNFVEFESQLTSEKLAETLTALSPASLQLGLPKFSFSSAFDMGLQLASLGMPAAFDRERADFSGITGRPDLYISKVLHQAFIAVDEEGTEAAAATSVIMAPTSAVPPDQILVVDRPFIFVISNLQTQQILFLGRIVDPSV